MKIGILSGTFDPVHSGHIELARIAINNLKLDQVLFVPELESRYKFQVTEFEHRLQMLKLALDSESNVEVFESELSTHSIELGTELKDRYSDAELYLLLGADVAQSVDSWEEPERIRQIFNVVSFGRYGVEAHLEFDHPASSKTIRQQLMSGEAIKYLSNEVLEYINEHKLYQG